MAPKPPDNHTRHDVGETHPERIEREEEAEKGVQGKWRRDLVLVAALLFAVVTVGWYTISQFTGDLRDSAVEGCERQNEVRGAFRADLRDDVIGLREDIEDAKAVDPKLFPGTPEAKFNRLVRKGVARDQRKIDRKLDRIANLVNTDCEAKYPG